MGAQVGIFGNKQECYGVNPTFSGMTLLSSGANKKTYWHFQDWLEAAAPYDKWQTSALGAGATAYTGEGLPTRPGVMWQLTGTTNTGRAGVYSGGYFAAITFSGGVYTFETQARLPILSTAIEEFAVYIGFGNLMAAEPGDGAYFKYDRTISVNWLAITADNSVRTSTDTGIPVNTNYTTFKVVVNALGTAVNFYINDVLVATNITNIPTVRRTSMLLNIIKSVGATSRSLLSDWVWLHYDLNISR